MRSHRIGGFGRWIAIVLGAFCPAVAGVVGCESDAPRQSRDGGDRDFTVVPAKADGHAVERGGAALCEPRATDYQPRTGDDSWPACISDDNTYHRIEESISTVARVGQFEEIAALLWDRVGTPTGEDFFKARVAYNTENGIGSRVERREDLHHPEVPNEEGDCTDEGIPRSHPARCVGPAQMLPILNDGFAGGMDGKNPLVNAARIEAALLWFLYVSPYKECHTCSETPRDCDSCYAYYTGGKDRGGGLGLSRYIDALDPETHDRVWDGLLAVRCWKNLDNESGVSTDTERRDQAIAQMDRAAIRGVALIVRQRLLRVETDTGDDRLADWAFVRILGAVLDREATVRDAMNATILRGEIGKNDPAEVDVDAAVDAIDAIFPCP